MSDSVIDPEALARLREWGGDRLLAQMIHLFVESTPDRIRQIREGLDRDEVELVERGAHSLKSSAANLGAERLRELSGEMEDRAHRGDLAAAGTLLVPLVEAHESALRALAAMREAAP
jgi:two-component system, sensor histidine kinase and response regulator